MELDDTVLVAELEEIILAVAGGDRAATAQLAQQLGRLTTPLTPGLKALLSDNLEMVIDDLAAVASQEDRQQLVLALAALDIDTMLLRDALAALCRAVHADYGDPAGLLRALGVLDRSVAVSDVLLRREVFCLLTPGVRVWHDAFLLGKLEEVDPCSDQVRCMFQRRQILSLAQAVVQLHVVMPSSIASTLTGPRVPNYKLTATPAAFDAAVLAAFTPPVTDAAPVAEALLVPRYVTLKRFQDWRAAPRQAAQRAARPTARSWDQARSLEELKEALAGVTAVTANDAAIATVSRIFQFAHAKPALAPLFGECVAMLLSLSQRAPWLMTLLNDMPAETVSWASRETFIEVCCKLPARLLPSWFEASIVNRGHDWFVDALVHLPLNMWATGETVLVDSGGRAEALLALALERFNSGAATADVVVWLWRRNDPNLRETFAKAKLIFRILLRERKGAFLKGRHELMKLLLSDEDFQCALMHGGSDYGIANFVKTIRSVPLLDKGQEQSLLVKIIRLYPQARGAVEGRRKAAPRRAAPRITSMRSYEARRRELQEIINRRIPANSAAIAHARSYGDLRENAEYKAAKDEQRLLMARRAELEKGLSQVAPTDFTEVQIRDVVIPGCMVELQIEGERHRHYVLGMWDSVPERGILSFDAPLGRALLGRHVGDRLDIPGDREAEVVALQSLPDEIMQWVAMTDPE